MNLDNIRLNKAATEPLYRQLVEGLKTAIEAGELKEGERLPPIRAWKERLGISPVTATQAYEVLAQEGFTTGQVGRGTFVRRPTPPQPTVSHEPVAEIQFANGSEAGLPNYLKTSRAAQVQRFLQTAQARYQANPERPANMIVMTSGSPAPELFALPRWKAAMVKAGQSLEHDGLSEGTNSLQFQYGSPLGDVQTRQWLSQYLTRFGLQTSHNDLMLTSGTQQALDLIARVFTAPGDPVLVESPSYTSALEIFESQGVQMLPVPLDRGGLILETVERLAARYHPRLLYTVPTAHSPTGITQLVERRVQLVELATRYNFFIVEDDTCNEFQYGSDPDLPAIKSFDRTGRVIYLKSFSKLIFPAVRLGTIVAAEPILEKLAYAKAIFDRYTSLPTARAVLEFARQPTFERDLNAAREVYRQRRDALLEGLTTQLAGSGCEWSECTSGLSLLLSLPRGVRASEFYLTAAEYGVAVLPGPVFYPLMNDAPDNTLRLTFGDNSPARLLTATRRLGEALQTFLTRERSGASNQPFIMAV